MVALDGCARRDEGHGVLHLYWRLPLYSCLVSFENRARGPLDQDIRFTLVAFFRVVPIVTPALFPTVLFPFFALFGVGLPRWGRRENDYAYLSEGGIFWLGRGLWWLVLCVLLLWELRLRVLLLMLLMLWSLLSCFRLLL